MSKCVRDADRLDILKPHFTANDISTKIEIKKGDVGLSCTRFKTRIRRSAGQVRLTLYTHIRITFDCRLWSGLTGPFFAITVHSVQDQPGWDQGARKESSRQSRHSRCTRPNHREN